MKDLIIRNYAATIKRGQITEKTTMTNFIAKLKEEIKELEESKDLNESYDSMEAIDCFLICASMLYHFSILHKVKEKVIINEQRALAKMPLKEAIKVMEAHEKWRLGGKGEQIVPVILTAATTALLSFARDHETDKKSKL